MSMVKNDRSQDVSDLSSTSYNRGFVSYNISVERTGVRRAFCQSTLLMAFGKQRKFRASRALFETIIVGQRSTLIRSSGYELDQIVDSRIT